MVVGGVNATNYQKALVYHQVPDTALHNSKGLVLLVVRLSFELVRKVELVL